MGDSWPVVIAVLQTVIAGLLAVFNASIQRNHTTLEAIGMQISALAVSMAKMASTHDGFEKRLEQHVGDFERRLTRLEEHMLSVKQ